jgi:hypothetical protein
MGVLNSCDIKPRNSSFASSAFSRSRRHYRAPGRRDAPAPRPRPGPPGCSAGGVGDGECQYAQGTAAPKGDRHRGLDAQPAQEPQVCGVSRGSFHQHVGDVGVELRLARAEHFRDAHRLVGIVWIALLQDSHQLHPPTVTVVYCRLLNLASFVDEGHGAEIARSGRQARDVGERHLRSVVVAASVVLPHQEGSLPRCVCAQSRPCRADHPLWFAASVAQPDLRSRQCSLPSGQTIRYSGRGRSRAPL